MTGNAKFSSKTLKRSHLRRAACLATSSRMEGLSGGRLSRAGAAIRLEPEERAAIAWAALRSLDRETAVATVEAAFEPEQGAGMPIAALDMDDPTDEAALWAAHASPDEIIAYAVAILRAMPKRRRRDFVDFAESEAA